MGKKEVFYIATFGSTFDAMEAESILENKVNCRLVPIPTELTAGCGMVLKVDNYLDFIDNDIKFSKIYKIEKEFFNKVITEIEL